MPIHTYLRTPGFVALLVVLLAALLAAVPLHAQTLPPCSEIPTIQTHFRSIEVWYGSAFDGTNEVASALELTDHVVQDLANQIILDPNVDPRVTSGIGAWVDNSVSDMDWVLGAPEHLPAEQALRAALAAALEAPAFAAPVDHGTEDYLVETWQTVEQCEDGQAVVDHEGFARVRYVELNAHDLGTCDPCQPWKNHGQYVSCVSHAVNDLVKQGVITRDEGDELVSSAAQSDIGKKGYIPPECQ